jgi:glycosyltransferase involved in cell wall biosynthesis
MPSRADPIDVLLVSPGTTAGWRRVDSDFASLLGELGLSVATATSNYAVVRHLRRTMAFTDLAEAAAMRHALTRALRRYSPRTIVYSSTQAAMLQPSRRLAGAGVRFDALTTVNRPGARNSLQHRLERRVLARVALLLPSGMDASSRVPPALLGPRRVVALPLAIDPPAEAGAAREPIVLCYAGNPDKKGLDLIVRAWRQARSAERRLVVTGIDPVAGRAFLAARSVEEPDRIEWAGSLPPERFRALTAAAEVFVSASRFEDYGLAQLEALAGGALLVTTPSPGPYEALALARELEPKLVASSVSPEALARALDAAFEASEPSRAAYRERARSLVLPYARSELIARVEREVLPVLLPGP